MPSHSHLQTTTVSSSRCRTSMPAKVVQPMLCSEWPEAVNPGEPAIPASPLRSDIYAMGSTSSQQSQQTITQNERSVLRTCPASQRKHCPRVPPASTSYEAGEINSRPMQMRPKGPLLRHLSSRSNSSQRVYRRLCHSDSHVDLLTSVIHEEDERVEGLSVLESGCSPVSSIDFDTVHARDLVSSLGSYLSHNLSVSTKQSSQPTRQSTGLGGRFTPRRGISRQYSLPEITFDTLGSSLMSSMPDEWIYHESDESRGSSIRSDSSESTAFNGSKDALSSRQTSTAKRKRIPRSLSDANINVTARWAQEPIEMFLTPHEDHSNIVRMPESHHPPPPYQEELGTGEMDFSFLDALQAQTSNDVAYSAGDIHELP